MKNNVVSGNGGDGIDYTLPDQTSSMTQRGISGNIVGLNSAGTAAIPNHGHGITASNLTYSSAPNTSSFYNPNTSVTLSILQNVVGGNDLNGIYIPAGISTSVEKNTVGLGADGVTVFGNAGDGVRIVNGTRITVYQNVIGGNGGDGIELGATSSLVSVTANKIGTDTTGTLAKGNGGAGLRSLVNEGTSTSYRFRTEAPDWLSATGNVIAHNGGAGIQMDGNVGLFVENTFGLNVGPALTGTGVLSAPILLSAVPVVTDAAGTSGITVSGSYQGGVTQFATIHFYATDASGTSRTFLGTQAIQTDALGTAQFSATVQASLSAGMRIVALATDSVLVSPGMWNPGGIYLKHTSLFSSPIPVATQITISNATVAEGHNGQSQLSFEVSLTNSNLTTVSVDFATANGTAIAGLDYLAQSGTLTFAPGEVVKTVMVSIPGDNVIEPNETVRLLLSNPIGTTLARDEGLGFIINDDAPSPATVSVSDASVAEGANSFMNFVVTLNEVQPHAVTVSYTTEGITALAGSLQDYLSQTGDITFAPGEISKTIAVPIQDHSPAYEGNETFRLRLTGSTGAELVRDAAIGTIIESQPAPLVGIGDVTLAEGHGGTKAFTFTVTRGANSVAGSVHYTTSADTALAGIDFEAASGTVQFSSGETSKTITVLVHGDTAIESDETFFVLLSDPINSALSDAVGLGTIKNDDGIPLPSVSIGSASQAEGQTGPHQLNFLVTLSAASVSDVTVQFTTVNGTAVAGSDFQAASGTFTIPAGQTSKTLSITTFGDFTPEFNETFSVVLSSPTEAVLGTAMGTGTLTTDDGLPTPVVNVRAASIVEGTNGDKTLSFVVTLDHADQTQYFVNFATIDGTAVAGTDYEAKSGTLVFAAGETSKLVHVTILGDAVEETDEIFTLALSGPTNLALGTIQNTGTILDDDGAVTTPIVSIANASHPEGMDGTKDLNFLVSLNHASPTDVTVNFSTVGGTAAEGIDFTGSTGTIIIPAGQTSAILPITTFGDNVAEGNETFSVILSAPANAALGASTATGMILNDDNTPSDFAISANHKIATWTDADGDRVTLRATRGVLDPSQFTFLVSDQGMVLGELDFSDVQLPKGISLTLTAKATSAGGNGQADLGHLIAPSDRISINVSGTLGGVSLGSSLGLGGHVIKAGVFGGETFADFGLTESEIHGAVKSIAVRGDWYSAQLTTSQMSPTRLGGIGAITIGGDFTGSPEIPAELHVDGGSLSKVSVRGSIEGASLDSRALISARSIGKVAVSGHVENADVRAGWDSNGAITNAPSRISSVIVKGRWSASNLTAGVAAGDDGEFGTSDDVQFAASRSLIGLLKVGMFEASEDMDDQFLVSSLKITKIIAAGKRVSLNARAIDDLPAPGAGDVRILEFV